MGKSALGVLSPTSWVPLTLPESVPYDNVNPRVLCVCIYVPYRSGARDDGLPGPKITIERNCIEMR
jgi:hypothetical protein